MVKNPAANAGDMGSTLGLGRPHMPWGAKPVGHNDGACALEPTSHNHGV